jgi:hypothetical protein
MTCDLFLYVASEQHRHLFSPVSLPLQHMSVIASVSSPSSFSGCLHAVALSCYNNVLWMGVSNCSLWRMELPAVDDIDVSRDSLAELCVKPSVTCELWSGALQRATLLLPYALIF